MFMKHAGMPTLMHERVPAMSLAVGEQTGASRRASSGLHGAPVLYSTRTSCSRPWRRMVVRSSLRARLSAATGRLFCAWDGGLTIEEWIWPGTQATGPCHGARPWRTVLIRAAVLAPQAGRTARRHALFSKARDGPRAADVCLKQV